MPEIKGIPTLTPTPFFSFWVFPTTFTASKTGFI